MRFQNLVFILFVSIFFTGCNSCGSGTAIVVNTEDMNTNSTINRNINTNENINADNSNTPETSQNSDPLSVEPIPKSSEKVQAETLKPVVDAYCAAMRKKDDAGLRSVFTPATIKALEADVKADGLGSIAELLELEPVGNNCQVVNETIQGNTAQATVITQTYPTGTSFTFEKVGNDWKMTRKSADFDRVDQN